MVCCATPETLKFYLPEELFSLSGNHETATKSLKRYFGGMSSIVLASNCMINRIGFQNKSIPRLKRYSQISPGRHISTVARYITSYRPALVCVCVCALKVCVCVCVFSRGVCVWVCVLYMCEMW